MDEFWNRPANKAFMKEQDAMAKEVAKGIVLDGTPTMGKGNESFPTDMGRELAEAGQHMKKDDIPDDETEE